MAFPFLDASLLAMDDLRAAAAGGALVDAVAGFLVFRHAERFDLAIGGGELATERDRADHALAGLPARRALRELGLGQLLKDFKTTLAAVAMPGARGVFVERHAPILSEIRVCRGPRRRGGRGWWRDRRRAFR